MRDCERQLREWFGREGCDNAMTRNLVCTPIAGAYGGVTDWVITLAGSPPRGTLVFRARQHPRNMHFIHRSESETFDAPEWLRSFEAAFLTGKTKTIVLISKMTGTIDYVNGCMKGFDYELVFTDATDATGKEELCKSE